ncbi:hypothetical protein HYV73_02425 [Candidatus Uhrbacteria bacterium]|nr:hypothetical protein [Candidatus Uhrbacteria bacterium]
MPDEPRYYTPEEQEFLRKYRFSTWWLGHRHGIAKVIKIIVFMAALVVLLWGMWVHVDTLFVRGPQETAALQSVFATQQRDVRATTKGTIAEPMVQGPVQVMQSGEGLYDLVARVSNPNADWYARFQYSFHSSAGDTAPQSAVLLPQAEQLPLVVFATPAAATPRDAELTISNFVWIRFDRHAYGTYETFAQNRLDWTIENQGYDQTFQVDNKTVGRVTFDVENPTSYGFYSPSFIILLKQGTRIVGVSRTTISDLRAGERESVSLNWFGTPPPATTIEIVPYVDPFDTQGYIGI